jgi:hypothetical protein
METFGQLTHAQGRFEYRCDTHNLVIRGDFAEWVLAAAAEITSKIVRDEIEGRLNELEALAEFGEGNPIDLDMARFEAKERFDRHGRAERFPLGGVRGAAQTFARIRSAPDPAPAGHGADPVGQLPEERTRRRRRVTLPCNSE